MGLTTPGRPLAWHLGALCAALLVPTLVLGGVLLLRVAGAERARHEAAARDAARHLVVTLDRGLATYAAMLEVLATSDYLRAGNLRAFHARALDVRRPPGAEVVLRDPDGRILASTGVPWGAPPPEADDGGAWRRAAEAGRPQVSDVVPPAAPGAPAHFVVVAPVRRGGGATTALLGLVVPAPVLAGLLRDEDVPAGMAAGLLDRRGAVAAATGGAGPVEGTFPGARGPAARVPLPAPNGDAGRGWLRLPAADGTPLVAAFSRSEVSGWTAVVSLPEATFAAPLRRSLLAAAALGAALAALAAALAHAFARRIARPIEALAGAAADAPPPLPRPRPRPRPAAVAVREVDAVARALAAARAEADRRAAEREALLGTLDLAQVLVREPGGAIVLWTSGMERLLGWRRGQALGRLSHELLATEFPAPLAGIEAELRARGEWRGELRQRRADGGRVVVASHWALRRGPGGEALAVVEASTDITALRAAEGRLRETQAELFRVARVNSMGAMAAAIAHELNQPLAAAANFAEAAGLLLGGGGGGGARAPDAGALAEARGAAAEAAAEVVRAGHILRRLRDFVGRGDGEKRLADANAIVGRAAALALAGTPDPDVALRLELDPAAPPVLADAVQLQQVVVNLVRNAAEAMRGAPRRELTVATAARGACGACGGAVEVSVADTGPGLAPDLEGRLFEPFVTTKPDGMGVGLAISRSIVEGHGGTLEAAPRPGGGAVFRFALPAVPEDGGRIADAA